LNNYLKHGVEPRQSDGWVCPDRFSSARYFDGWREIGPEAVAGAPGALVARGGWKLCVAWRKRYPLISIEEFPGR
jgi:hypothetical protein